MHWKVAGSSLLRLFQLVVRLLVEAGAVDQPDHHRHWVNHHRRRLSFVVVLGVVGAGCLLHHRVKGVVGVGEVGFVRRLRETRRRIGNERQRADRIVVAWNVAMRQSHVPSLVEYHLRLGM